MPVLNAGAAVALAERVTGLRIDPFGDSQFLVEIQGMIVAGFQSISGLSQTTETHTVWEGGVNTNPHIIPVRTSYTPLVLTKGVTDFDMMWAWYQDVVKGDFKRRNGTIYLLTHVGVPGLYWNFSKAFPSHWEGPTLNAQSNSVAAQSITLHYEGLTNPIGEKIGQLGNALGGTLGSLAGKIL